MLLLAFLRNSKAVLCSQWFTKGDYPVLLGMCWLENEIEASADIFRETLCWCFETAIISHLGKTNPPTLLLFVSCMTGPNKDSGMGTWAKAQWSWIKSCFRFCFLSLFSTLSRAGCESRVWLLTWLLNNSFSKWVWPLLLLSPFPSTSSLKAPCSAQLFVLCCVLRALHW